MELSIDHQIGLLFALGILAFWGTTKRVCRIRIFALFFTIERSEHNTLRCPLVLYVLIAASAAFCVAMIPPDTTDKATWLPLSFFLGYSISFALYLIMRRHR
jgi:hypothetical protein